MAIFQRINLGQIKRVARSFKPHNARQTLKQILGTRLYSNALFLVLDNSLSGGLGFLFWLVVARFYTQEELGLGSSIISTIQLLGTLSLTGLNFSLVRFLSKSNERQKLINTCLTTGGILAMVASGVFLAGIGLWSPAMNFILLNPLFILAFIAFTVVTTLSLSMDWVFLANRRVEFRVFKNGISSILKIPLPIILILYFHTFGVVASWGMATVVAVILALFLLLPKLEKNYKPVPTVSVRLLRSTWSYSLSNYFANLLSSVTSFILPIMVVNLLGAKSNAYFYTAWMIASVVFYIPSGISNSLFSEGSHFEDKLQHNVKRSLKFTFCFLVPVIIVLVLVGKWLLLAFGASYSANSFNLLIILAVSGIPIGFNQIYTSCLRVLKRLKELVAISLFITLAVLVGSYFLMPIIGIMGVGYTWLGSSIYRCPVHNPWSETGDEVSCQRGVKILDFS